MASVNRRYTAAQAVELTLRSIEQNRASDVEDESSADEDYSDVNYVDETAGTVMRNVWKPEEMIVIQKMTRSSLAMTRMLKEMKSSKSWRSGGGGPG